MPVLLSSLDLNLTEPKVTSDHTIIKQPNRRPYPTDDSLTNEVSDDKDDTEVPPPVLVSLLDTELLNFNQLIPNHPKLKLPPRLLSAPDSPYQMVDPNSFRITLRTIPISQKLVRKTGVPLGLVVTPYRKRDSSNTIPIIKDPPIQCRQCKSYLSPFTLLYLDGYSCGVCQSGKYFPDISHYSNPNFHSQLAFQHNVVEYQLTTEPIATSPSLILVLDTSKNAIDNGSLVMILNQLISHLDKAANLQKNLKVGFLTMNEMELQFYKLNKITKNWEILVINDLNDYDHSPPHPDQLLVDLLKYRREVDNLLMRILTRVTSPPTVKSDSRVLEVGLHIRVLEVGLHISNLILKPTGGKIILFTSTCPPPSPITISDTTSKSYLPDWFKNPDPTYQPDPNSYYKQLALSSIEYKVAYDLFLFGNEIMKELINLSCLTKYTGGELFTYPHFPTLTSNQQFMTNLTYILTTEWGFDCTFSTTYYHDFYPNQTYGHLYQFKTKTILRPCTYFNWTYLMDINYEFEIYNRCYLGFQSKMTYTGQDGLKYLRVMSLTFNVTNSITDLVINYDPIAIIMFITHQVLNTLVMRGLTSARQQLRTSYKKFMANLQSLEGRPSTSLMVWDHLNCIPLILKALNHHVVLREDSTMKLSERYEIIYRMISLSSDKLVEYLIPGLFKLNLKELENVKDDEDFKLMLIKLPLTQSSLTTNPQEEEFVVIDTVDTITIVMNDKLNLFGSPSVSYQEVTYSQLTTTSLQPLIEYLMKDRLPKLIIVNDVSSEVVKRWMLLDRMDYPRCLT